MQKPEIAVVIASHNRALRLRWLLNSLEDQSLDRHRFEVIVAHDSDDDGATAKLLAEHPINATAIRHEPQNPTSTPPPSSATPPGARPRRPSSPSPTTTAAPRRPGSSRRSTPRREHPGAVIQGMTLPDPDEESNEHGAFPRTQHIVPPVPWAQACNIVYPRELLEELNGFVEDPPLAAGEDFELAFRARQTGAPYVGARDALTWHAVYDDGLREHLKGLNRWGDLAWHLKKHPEARADYPLWIFWKRTHVWLPVAAAGAVLAHRTRRRLGPARAPVGGPLRARLRRRPPARPPARGVRAAAARPRRRRRDGRLPARRAEAPHPVPVKVAFLSPVFWPEVRRGTERVVHELTAELLARGHEPRLITSTRQRPSTTVEDGLPITRVPRLPAGRLTRRRFEDHLTHLPFAYAALNRGDDDVANAVYVTDALVAARWSRRTGRPAVFSYMGIPDHAGLTARRRRVELTLAATEGAAATVVLSKAARDAFARWLGVEAEIIAPPVDVDAFTPDPAARAAEPTIVCGADLAAPRKRVPLLVEAFALVRRNNPGARLILSRPRDPATAIPDGPGIELRDLDDRKALAAVYREAWVSALPSTGEAFGLVLAEALACGTPVVATNEGGMREVVDSDAIGRLFDGDDPAALAAAITEALELTKDPQTAHKARARAEDFSTQRCCDAYLDLYTRLRNR